MSTLSSFLKNEPENIKCKDLEALSDSQIALALVVGRDYISGTDLTLLKNEGAARLRTALKVEPKVSA